MIGENTNSNEFLKQLKDKKEDLDYLDQQIANLKLGLKEMPDKSQNGYFRDLLKDYQGKEFALNLQINQLDRQYQDLFRSAFPKDTHLTPPFSERYQENLQNRTQGMVDLMEASQMRAQDQLQMISNLQSDQFNAQEQMQRINDLAQANQMHMDALIQRTNDLIELNQLQLQNYAQKN